MINATETTYEAAGVATERQELALQRVIEQVRRTWELGNSVGSQRLPIGFFANVIEIGGMGIAISTDGVGTKALVAQMVHKYDTIGIDCVAMNVNDIICVGATPVSMVDYIAVQDVNPDLMEQVAVGLCKGALQAGISISGGETAQLRDIIQGYRQGFGFDLVGTAIGVVAPDKILVGKNIADGDIIVGLRSNGIHCNGLALARHVLFKQAGFAPDKFFPGLQCTIGEELLKPTHIYVREAVQLLKSDVRIKALIHITSDGFLNLTRVDSNASYIIDALPSVPPVFDLIQDNGHVADEEMFRVFNMGIGFCIVVHPGDVSKIIAAAAAEGKVGEPIGYVRSDGKRQVVIEQRELVGVGKSFARG